MAYLNATPEAPSLRVVNDRAPESPLSLCGASPEHCQMFDTTWHRQFQFFQRDFRRKLPGACL